MDGGWVQDVGGVRSKKQARVTVGWRRELISGRSEEKLLLTTKTGNHSCCNTAHTHTHTLTLSLSHTPHAHTTHTAAVHHCKPSVPKYCDHAAVLVHTPLAVCLCVLIPVLVCCQSFWHCIVFCAALWSSNFGPGGDNGVLSGRGGRGRLCVFVCVMAFFCVPSHLQKFETYYSFILVASLWKGLHNSASCFILIHYWQI